MIGLYHVSKSYPSKQGRKRVLKDINITFEPGINMGILGLNGAGKSTLMRILCGTERPDSGKVLRSGRVSWPIGFSGGFHASLTGRENMRFTSRIYGADVQQVTKFVEDFAELGSYMDMPIKTYSSGMKSRLAFGLSMAIGFDFYLIDEGYSAGGDLYFQKKAEAVFQERKAQATLIVVSHGAGTIRKNCDLAVVLINGELFFYDNLEESLTAYKELCHAR